jgi:hypothetical protein
MKQTSEEELEEKKIKREREQWLFYVLLVAFMFVLGLTLVIVAKRI